MDGGTEVKNKKKFIIMVSVFAVVVVALVVAIIVVVNRKTSADFVEAENVGLTKQQEILDRYNTRSDYTAQDAMADFKIGINDCENAGCRAYVRASYARFLYMYSGDLSKCMEIIASVEDEIDDMSDIARARFYLAIRELMAEAEQEELVKYYDALVVEALGESL